MPVHVRACTEVFRNLINIGARTCMGPGSSWSFGIWEYINL